MSNVFPFKLEEWDPSYQVQIFNALTQGPEIIKEQNKAPIGCNGSQLCRDMFGSNESHHKSRDRHLNGGKVKPHPSSYGWLCYSGAKHVVLLYLSSTPLTTTGFLRIRRQYRFVKLKAHLLNKWIDRILLMSCQFDCAARKKINYCFIGIVKKWELCTSCQGLRSDGISIHKSFYFSNQYIMYGDNTIGQLLSSTIDKFSLEKNRNTEHPI